MILRCLAWPGPALCRKQPCRNIANCWPPSARKCSEIGVRLLVFVVCYFLHGSKIILGKIILRHTDTPPPTHTPCPLAIAMNRDITIILNYCSQSVLTEVVFWSGTITLESQDGKYWLMPGAQWSCALLTEPATPLPAPPCLLRPSPIPPWNHPLNLLISLWIIPHSQPPPPQSVLDV